MDGSIPTRIAIVGGGTAGWMAAAVLARYLDPRLYTLSLVESDAIGTVGVGEATIPQLQLINQALGFDEDDFVRATQATFKLGIEFAGWGDVDSRYMHAFGPVGRAVGPVAFQHYWLRARAGGDATPLGAYSLNTAAAYAGRFARGGTAQSPGGLGHAYHFDAGLYAAYLRRFAQSRGVRRIEGQITHVACDGLGGDVTMLMLDGGGQHAADFFVDCSGLRSLLLGEALGTPFVDWTHWLACDRAVAVACAAGAGGLTPYTRATARGAGWQWRIPLQHRVGNGHVYCSALIDDDAAAAQLLGNLDGAPLADPRVIRFTTGRRAEFWRGNVVALGLAAGFLEPLESTSIHLVQSGLERLLRFLPGPGTRPADVAAFNAQTAFEWERVRDFIILHYHVNRRPEPFWQDRAAMAVPDSLTEKLELFAANGRITRFNEELFAEVGWLQVLVGQGLIPAGWHPLANALGTDELAELLGLLRRAASQPLAAMPTHAEFIARHCRAGATQDAAA